MDQSPTWEDFQDFQQVKKLPPFYETRRFITAVICPYPEKARPSPQPHHTLSWRSILILTSHLRMGLPSDLFPSRFLTKTLHTPLLSHIRATSPAHPILLDFITGIS